jgi:two-component system chemotaxis sensor kinase CheA
MVDAVRQILVRIEVTGHEGEEDYAPLKESLTKLCAMPAESRRARAPGPAASVRPTGAPARRTGAPPPAGAARATAVPPAGPPAPREADDGQAAAGAEDGPIRKILVKQGALAPEALASALHQQKTDPRRVGEILVAHGAVQPAAVLDALVAQGEARAAVAAADATVRVDVGLLDKLMNLVGELVLARNQILQFATHTTDSAFIGTSQRLNLITTELQEGVMKTRMQPIGNVWNKLPRIVRDLAVACGKQVRIEMEGKETDLDRTIIEAIKDVLTHVVRNAVDHGIEAPEARAARGKPTIGTLLLRAFHEGGQVNIEISDDGAGIDPEKIRVKAVQRGLLLPDRAARMSDRELVNVIFMPGFSTAEQVTNVSGRGVGMDVVRTNVEKIGGTVDVQSVVGQGTVLKIKIPLTLAIIPALVVSSLGERYAIPQVSLLELVRIEGEQVRTAVETIRGTPVYRLRGHLLPLVYLNRVLGFPDRIRENGQVDSINIVVLSADHRQFGLVVDNVNDTEEIVVKPLGKELKAISVFAGATIMGDGKVALILDVLGIAQRANVVSEVRDRTLAEATRMVAAKTGEVEALLLFKVRENGRMAIPLSMVARLEEFSSDLIEQAGGQDVVQYRGEILRLVDLRRMLGGAPSNRGDERPLQVIVYSEGGKRVGFVVEQIVDIVEEQISARHTVSQSGILAAAVVHGKVTDLVDVHGVLRSVDPKFFDRQLAS